MRWKRLAEVPVIIGTLGYPAMNQNNEIDLEELSAVMDSEDLKAAFESFKIIVDSLQSIARTGKDYLEDPRDPIDDMNIVLDSLREIVPEIDGLADRINGAWWEYQFAIAATMDEALGYSRPKHWRQEAEKFRINNISSIRREIERLNKQGVSMEDAFVAVGDKYSKSSGLIKKLYYDLIRRKREHPERFPHQ